MVHVISENAYGSFPFLLINVNCYCYIYSKSTSESHTTFQSLAKISAYVSKQKVQSGTMKHASWRRHTCTFPNWDSNATLNTQVNTANERHTLLANPFGLIEQGARVGRNVETVK